MRTKLDCPPPGIYQNVPFDTYAKWDAVNPSLAKQMRISAAHFRYHELEAPDTDSAAFALGRAAHCCVYEPDAFPLRYVVWTGGRKQGGVWDEFKDANSDKSIISKDDYATAIGVRDAVRNHPKAKALFTVPASIEACIVWVDPTTGLLCKGRVDYYAVRLNDLKTCRTLDQRIIASDTAKYGYHISMAAYQSGISVLKGELAEPVLIFANKEPYFDCIVMPLTDDAQNRGHDIWTELLQRIAECRETGVYPGIAPDEYPLDLPPWEMGEAEEMPALTFGGVPLEEMSNG